MIRGLVDEDTILRTPAFPGFRVADGVCSPLSSHPLVPLPAKRVCESSSHGCGQAIVRRARIEPSQREVQDYVYNPTDTYRLTLVLLEQGSWSKSEDLQRLVQEALGMIVESAHQRQRGTLIACAHGKVGLSFNFVLILLSC